MELMYNEIGIQETSECILLQNDVCISWSNNSIITIEILNLLVLMFVPILIYFILKGVFKKF